MDGFGLMHSLTSDVIKALLNAFVAESTAHRQQAALNAWTVVSCMNANPCRANVLGKTRTSLASN